MYTCTVCLVTEYLVYLFIVISGVSVLKLVISMCYALHLINTNNVYCNSLYCKSKIVKITDLLVSTVASNSGNINLIGCVGCYVCMVIYT